MFPRIHVLSLGTAPALGDVRVMDHSDMIVIRSDAPNRRDWSRYWDAIGIAFMRGALVVRG